MRLRLLSTAGLILSFPAVATAQEELNDEPEIVVTGQPPRGSVAGDIKPDLVLGPGDVRALGVSNVTELFAELAPQLASGVGSGPPVVLLEGRRISGFREIATFPAEAIARVDILPEEVALKYGYSADQKVVNIVLRQRFRAFTLEAGSRAATAGGAYNGRGAFDFLRIWREGRFNLNADFGSTGRLLESQRGIVNPSGQSDSRTLIPSEDAFKLNATLNRIIAGNVSATLNGEVITDATEGWLGRQAPALLPLSRRTGTQTGYAAASLNGDIGKWRWSWGASYTRTDTRAILTRGFDPVPLASGILLSRIDDQAQSASDVGAAAFTLSGSPLAVPAGRVNMTAKLGAVLSNFASQALRSGVTSAGRVSREIADGQVNIDVPITSRRAGVLGAIGDLSINGNAAVRRLSDYGTLRTIGYGLTWVPVKAVRFTGAFTDADGAPTPQQIGDPLLTVPGVRAFDFVRGTDAIVTLTSGGNPALRASNARTWKLGLNVKPFDETELILHADYVRTRTTNGIAALPPASAASQAAFAGRYTRDASGALAGIDARAVNFAEAEASQLRWGINFSKPLKASQAQIDAMRAHFRERFPNGRPPGAGGPGGPGAAGGASRGGGRGFGGGPGGGGRLTLALYHTLHLTDTVTLADGVPRIDLLNGGAIGNGGGQPRHEVEVQAGLARNGFGSRLSANWQSATRIDGSAPGNTLRFSDIAKVDFRLFANLGQMPSLLRKAPWLRGARVTVGVSNLFDARQRVTDASGATPFAYQGGYLDPLGRTIRISFRKLLF